MPIMPINEIHLGSSREWARANSLLYKPPLANRFRLNADCFERISRRHKRKSIHIMLSNKCHQFCGTSLWHPDNTLLRHRLLVGWGNCFNLWWHANTKSAHLVRQPATDWVFLFMLRTYIVLVHCLFSLCLWKNYQNTKKNSRPSKRASNAHSGVILW